MFKTATTLLASPLLDRAQALLDGPLGALLGGLCYGSWAAYSNRSAGAAEALTIALAHASLSIVLTLSGVATMNRLFRLARDPHLGIALASGGSLLLTYALLLTVHRLLGTPHVWLTLAPGVLPTVGFCIAYSLLLWRHHRLTEDSSRALPSPLH